MNKDRKEYFKNYRENHKEKYREYQKKYSNNHLSTYEKLKQENNRLLELCMYALIRDTKIYNHELDKQNKLKFMNTIRNNLNDDTYTLRQKLIDVWSGKYE